MRVLLVKGIAGILRIGIAVIGFRRLRRIGNGLFFQVFLAGDIVYDAGNGDGWVDVGCRTGVSKIIELFGNITGHIIIAGDDTVDAGMTRCVLVHAKTFGERGFDPLAFRRIERHRHPIGFRARRGQRAGRGNDLPVFEIRSKHRPNTFEHVLRESRVCCVTAFIGGIVGE